MSEPRTDALNEAVSTPPCPPLMVPLTNADHRVGSVAAPVVLVEYGDYECPYCLNAQPVVKEVRRRLGDRLAFVFRHFPQNSIHPHASTAAQAAEAAAAQGKFWEMHDLLYQHQQELADLDLTHLALGLGLEVYRFESDLQSASAARHIRADLAGALQSGVKGTPTFFINGCRYDGPAEVEALVAAIEREPFVPSSDTPGEG
jgi:protein-disulfide isomerase